MDGWLQLQSEFDGEASVKGLYISISKIVCGHSIWIAKTGSHFETFQVQGWTMMSNNW